MKHVCLVLLIICSFTTITKAQNISNNALGLRIGDNDGIGAEINYQRALSESNRLEFGLGWRSKNSVDALKLTGLYQWVFQLDGDFNWYAGAGGGLVNFSFDNDYPGNFDNETSVFIAGDIGIEYSFDFPILISLDFRPELGFGEYRDDINFDIALGVRYQF